MNISIQIKKAFHKFLLLCCILFWIWATCGLIKIYRMDDDLTEGRQRNEVSRDALIEKEALK
jgi:hypothetical protein